jgi:pSer/pThr/pTyr-binding forkhead associated (FHA) protein
MNDQPPPQPPPSGERPMHTRHLNLPPSGEVVSLPQTGVIRTPQTLREGTLFELTFDSGSLRIAARDKLILGRVVDGDLQRVDIDLAPFGAFQQGVSRRHALLRLHSGALYIQDSSSTNGTRINGAKLDPEREYLLREGDELEFGRIRAAIRFIPDDMEA